MLANEVKCVGFRFQLFMIFVYLPVGDSVPVEFSPTMWLLGIELRSSGLVASTSIP